MKRTIWVCLLVFGLMLSWILVYAADFYVIPVKVKVEKKNYSPVEKTGQTASLSFWDDGYLQKGVVWPNPRFTDNGNGTVTDNLTGLIWMKDANCFGVRPWDAGVSGEGATWDCFYLEDGDCGLTDGSTVGQWRLPNVKEILSLIAYGYANPPIPNTAGTAQWTEGDPFINVMGFDYYWTSTASYTSTTWALRVYMGGGLTSTAKITEEFYLWPVRNAD